MRFTVLFSLAFSLSGPTLHAQYDDLLHDPNITWLAEQTLDFELNPVYNNQLDEEYNLLTLVRLDNLTQAYGFYGEIEPDRYLSQKLLESIRSEKMDCFADAGLTQPMSKEQVLNRLDHPNAADQPDREAVQATDIDLFRVRLLLYFDARKQRFDTRLLAVAPLLNIPDAEGSIARRLPLLWIRPRQITQKKEKKALKTAAYVLQTRTKDNTPDWVDWSARKGKMDLKRWATLETAAPSHPVLSPENYTPMSAQALQANIFKTDTLNTFNDEGQSVIDRIVRINAIDQVEKLRLVHQWYFDERLQLLGCRLVAVAPLEAIRTQEGRLRYYKPLFYVPY